MNTCPKCGAERVQEAPAFSLTSRIWFGCGSYSYADATEKLEYRNSSCLDREEINDLQSKVAELHDLAQDAIDELYCYDDGKFSSASTRLQTELDKLKSKIPNDKNLFVQTFLTNAQEIRLK